MKSRTLGILSVKIEGSPPFAESSFFSYLTTKGEEFNIDVFVFTPESVSISPPFINGFKWSKDRWIKKNFSYPTLIYDRCFYHSPGYYQKSKPILDHLKRHPEIIFINHGLMGKHHVFKILSQYDEAKRYLPPQENYKSPIQLQKWLEHYKSVILKPNAGTHGKGIFHITKEEKYHLEGRDINNNYFNKRELSFNNLMRLLHPFINRKGYILQKFLHLNTPNGEPFDIRIFTQKNGNGEWEIIGQGVRLGSRGKLTSNLHGGGTAEPLDHFLQKNFKDQAQQISQSLTTIGKYIPPLIEKNYKPLFELGIDIGLDQSGHPWILEVNSKPGREIFRLLRDQNRYQIVTEGPIHYAKYLLEHV